MKLAVLGASGRTGHLIVEQALAAGHTVRALVRDAARLTVQHPKLELVQGDATDGASVKRLVEGCDAVVSALGPRKDEAVCSTAAANVIAAGVRRYVAISGAGIDVPGDQKGAVARLVSLLVRTVSPKQFEDKVKEHALLAASPVEWTLVRPPRLVDRPGTGKPRSSSKEAPSAMVSREDLAAFTLAAASDPQLIRKAPFVAN